jgi:hypothetical protein
MTKPVFKKGDAVCWISDWDNKGQVRIVRAVVYSCGKKRMVLSDAASGEELGRNYRPREVQGAHVVCGCVTLEGDEAKVEAMALELGRQIIAHQHEQYARCLASGGGGAGYQRLIEAERAKLRTEPACFWGRLPPDWNLTRGDAK